MNNWPSVSSGAGSITVTDFGVGIHRDGLYTPTEIMNKGKLLKKELGDFTYKAFPHPEDGLSQFIWTRWDRFGHKASQEMSNRSRLLSNVTYSHKDFYENYSGLGKPYDDCFDQYIPMRHRWFALERAYKKTTFKNKRLLDLGCASGNQMLGFSHRGIIPYGLEINPWFLKDLSPLIKDNVIFGDAMMDTYLFADASFDIVISSVHGFCAYPEMQQLFSEVARMMVLGGVFLLDIPHPPIYIGPNLSVDFRSYTRLLKNCGFKVSQLVHKQIVCILLEKKKWLGASN
jgi:SAM-dependent methyltransferase